MWPTRGNAAARTHLHLQTDQCGFVFAAGDSVASAAAMVARKNRFAGFFVAISGVKHATFGNGNELVDTPVAAWHERVSKMYQDRTCQNALDMYTASIRTSTASVCSSLLVFKPTPSF